MDYSVIFDGLVLRILFLFALAISFLLTERRFSFDWKQKAKIFLGFLTIVYVGLIMGAVILASVFEFLKS